MALGLLFQTVTNGLTIGAIYCLLALGLTLLFGIMDILFFAHGAMFMFGAYSVYHLCMSFGLNYFPAAVITIAAIGLLGLIIEKGLFRPVRGQMMTVFFIAISLNWLLESVGFVLFGIKPKRLTSIFPGKVEFFGAMITWDRAAIVLIGLMAVLALHFFLTRTKWGLAMRAFAEDPDAAELQGISNDFVCTLGFVIACSLAALAGLLVAPLYLISPTMGEHAVLTGLLIIALGGLGSIPGALIGAILLGLIESFSATLLGAGYTWGPVFIFVVIFLIIRPTGIMGLER